MSVTAGEMKRSKMAEDAIRRTNLDPESAKEMNDKLLGKEKKTKEDSDDDSPSD